MSKSVVTEPKRGRGSGDVIFRILDSLADMALTAPVMIGAILEAGYGASSSKIEGTYQKNLATVNYGVDRERRRREYHRYSMMLRYLREQGMLSQKTTGETIKLYITKEGRKKLARMRLERRENIPGYGYESSPGKKIVIVTYDIPEKRRADRNWLRAILKRLGLDALQRSVWVGKVALPTRFIEDLALRHMTEFVEIVEVGSAGTLQHLA